MYVLLCFPPNTLLAESPAVEAISMKSAIAGDLLGAEIVCSLSECVVASWKIRKTANRIQPTRTLLIPCDGFVHDVGDFHACALIFISRIDSHWESDLDRRVLSPADVRQPTSQICLGILDPWNGKT